MIIDMTSDITDDLIPIILILHASQGNVDFNGSMTNTSLEIILASFV